MSEKETDEKIKDFYYCKYCEMWLPINGGVIIHTELWHPSDFNGGY